MISLTWCVGKKIEEKLEEFLSPFKVPLPRPPPDQCPPPDLRQEPVQAAARAVSPPPDQLTK